jgi:two-component system response regulator (stage 0 sporulation protein F)
MTDSLGRILVVDDERSVVEVLSEYFSGQGYTVRTASDGHEALAAVPEYRPAVVLLDVRMPGLDGVEVLRRIRASDKSIAVIMVTANEDVELARETLKLGAFDYVAKPFDFGYLDQAVTLGLIQSGGGPSAPTGTRGAETAEGPEGVWHGLTLATFRAALAMSASGRDSTGQRMESAALAAAREGEARRPAAAAEFLQELETLLAIAAELGDVSPTARDAVHAAIAAARTSLSSAG